MLYHKTNYGNINYINHLAHIKMNTAIKKIIEENPISLSTINTNNTPNVIAVAFAKVVSENQIVITDNYMSQTKENIKKNNNICIAAWNKDWDGYKLVGTAEYLDSGKWKKLVENIKENKGMSAKGAILIKVAKIIKLH